MTPRILGILGLLLLAACGAALPANPVAETQATPTPSRYFNGSVMQLQLQPDASREGAAPTQSALFLAGQAVDPQPGQTADKEPTVSSYFIDAPGKASATPTQSPLNGVITPTLSAIFKAPIQSPTNTPSFAAQATQTAPTPKNTSTPVPPNAAAGSAEITRTDIFSGELAVNWTLENSWGVDWVLANQDYAFQGNESVKVTPKEDFGAVFFTVKNSPGRTYPRSKTLGVSFWINPGVMTIRPDQLAVTVVGSNDYPYWLKGDTTVAALAKGVTFSETRLYYLDVNRSLPLNSWTEIILWLDKLIYDPNYENVTGFYIKNDKDFRQAFYIANVTLLEVK